MFAFASSARSSGSTTASKTEGAGDAERGRDPDRRGGGEAVNFQMTVVAQHHARAEKAYAGHHALHDALNHAAHRVGVAGHALHPHGGQCDQRGAHADEAERAHARRFAAQIAVDADEHAAGRRHQKTQQCLDIRRLKAEKIQFRHGLTHQRRERPRRGAEGSGTALARKSCQGSRSRWASRVGAFSSV